MKKPLLICLALVAVAAIALACVFGFQKAGLQKQVDSLTAELNTKAGDLDTAKGDLESVKGELEAAQAELTGMKEQAEKAKKPADIRFPDFFGKYQKQGQRTVTQVSLTPGSAMTASMPEDAQKPVQDLLNALKIEVVTQGIDGMKQGSLRLALNDEPALDITGAADGTGLYVGSSLLGDKVVRVTEEQLKGLANQLVSSGAMSQEQVDKLLSSLFGGSMPSRKEALASLLGNANVTPLLTALAELIPPQGMQMQPLDEVPGDVTINAAYSLVIPLKKDALVNIAEEAAKLIWSLPMVQQSAGAMQLNGAPMTEENLTKALRAFPDMMAEDTEFRLYTTADGNEIQGLCSALLDVNGTRVPLDFNMKADQGNSGMRLEWTADLKPEGQDGMQMAGKMDMTSTEEGGNLTYVITAAQTQDGSAFTPVEETISAVWTIAVDAATADLKMDVKVLETPDAEPRNVVFAAKVDKKDLGDHAEQNVTFTVSEAKAGELFTLDAQSRTDMGEAYIIAEGAAEPLAMNQEELGAFMQEISGSAMQGLGTLIGKLPESVQPLVMQLFGGGK